MDNISVIDNVRRRLKHLTREQRNTRVGDTAPTIAELLSLLGGDMSTVGISLDSDKSYYLGQLVVILDLLTTRDRRSTRSI